MSDSALDSQFNELDECLRSEGPARTIERLVAHLRRHGPPRELLEALLLRARHDLGLPLLDPGPLKSLPEALRTAYEDRYIEAIRTVGQGLLQSGDIVGAWPYFRLLGEREPVAKALEAAPTDPDDHGMDSVIEIAFNQGAHPRLGFEMILNAQGLCPAITAFEHLPPDEALRGECASLLVQSLHAALVSSLQADIASRQGQPAPPEETIRDLVANRPELFLEDNYHTDLSHLAAVVRLSLLVEDKLVIEKARDLAHYGLHLSSRLTSPGEPPFENLYESHEIYLSGVLGTDTERAVTFFQERLTAAGPDYPLPAQVLIRLLERSGRLDAACDVAEAYLAGVREDFLICSSFPSLCSRTGRSDRLARAARGRGDLVLYAAARLASAKPSAR